MAKSLRGPFNTAKGYVTASSNKMISVSKKKATGAKRVAVGKRGRK